jgi:hypothetical protein
MDLKRAEQLLMEHVPEAEDHMHNKRNKLISPLVQRLGRCLRSVWSFTWDYRIVRAFRLMKITNTPPSNRLFSFLLLLSSIELRLVESRQGRVISDSL